MFATHSVLCFSSKFVRDFPDSECRLWGTPSTFCLSQRCPWTLLLAGTCSPMPSTTQSLPRLLPSLPSLPRDLSHPTASRQN